jgi:hypothetical protein
VRESRSAAEARTTASAPHPDPLPEGEGIACHPSVPAASLRPSRSSSGPENPEPHFAPRRRLFPLSPRERAGVRESRSAAEARTTASAPHPNPLPEGEGMACHPSVPAASVRPSRSSSVPENPRTAFRPPAEPIPPLPPGEGRGEGEPERSEGDHSHFPNYPILSVQLALDPDSHAQPPFHSSFRPHRGRDLVQFRLPHHRRTDGRQRFRLCLRRCRTLRRRRSPTERLHPLPEVES